MATLRPLAENDIPAVAALFGRVYPQHRWASQAACESYFREMLFDNPWRDLQLPSWVAEENGRIAGIQAVIPRRMQFCGRSIRVAVNCQLMVDPDKRHSLIALQLAKACLSGPQDLTLTDGANDLSRRMWIVLGGTAPPLYNLHWIRPLRPARYMLSLLEDRAAFILPLTLAARPLSVLADTLAARLRPDWFPREQAGLTEDALDPATMLEHLPDVMNGSLLQPAYDTRSLMWLLNQAALKIRHGTLRARAVRSGKLRLIGWYLYYVRAGGISEVVQIAARKGSFEQVFQHLLADAWRHGALAVRGRLDPGHAAELSDRCCWLRRESPCTLVHSRFADVLAAIHQGGAFLSRLEGEWWLRFQGG
ncbi:MAG: GNAT family N-acetyltransferase [Betaproteobacteria bacterium]|nr:GNAT family N-acetyltransferase [Betaproteobacteria bacterium]